MFFLSTLSELVNLFVLTMRKCFHVAATGNQDGVVGDVVNTIGSAISGGAQLAGMLMGGGPMD